MRTYYVVLTRPGPEPYWAVGPFGPREARDVARCFADGNSDWMTPVVRSRRQLACRARRSAEWGLATYIVPAELVGGWVYPALERAIETLRQGGALTPVRRRADVPALD